MVVFSDDGLTSWEILKTFSATFIEAVEEERQGGEAVEEEEAACHRLEFSFLFQSFRVAQLFFVSASPGGFKGGCLKLLCRGSVFGKLNYHIVRTR